MKYLCCILLSLAATAFGINVGDTYEHVVAEREIPGSQVEVGSRRVVQYPNVAIVFRDNVVLDIKPVTAPPVVPRPSVTASPVAASSTPAAVEVVPEPTGSPEEQKKILLNFLGSTALRVMKIVNQPVAGRPRADAMKVKVLAGYWYPARSMLPPDFNNIDVRQTQEFPYGSDEYVALDRNPELVFLGRDLEYNPKLPYFYVDRSKPRKRLTESEMLEINRLCHLLWEGNLKLIPLGQPRM